MIRRGFSLTAALVVQGMLAGCASTRPAAPEYSYVELVGRLTDLEALALRPPAGERTALASSHDRASRYDPLQDRYIAWGANDDCCGVVARADGTQTLADIKGPGVIWRIWSAQPTARHVKFYLDGASRPAIDLPFTSFFGGGDSPFREPNLAYDSAGGLNNYTPITFAKGCRIVADDGWGRYYQFTYSTFPADVPVRPFRLPIPTIDAAALRRADEILGRAGQDPAGPRPGQQVHAVAMSVAPRTSRDIIRLDGPQAIVGLTVRIDDLPADPERQRLRLRSLALRVTWDDEATPAIWSPLGDFFGDVGGAAPYRSLPMGRLPDGTFYSYWYMPFARRARLELANDGDVTVSMTWHVTRAPLDHPVQNYLRLHAKWHRDADPPVRADRAPDWILLTTRGQGRYVGTHLHVWNPRGGWWGEGDDKFFVDGEAFPSIFGTGSEDYFGYAYASASLFDRPYHDQILSDKLTGHVVDNRWHIADSIPFQTGLQAAIEKYFANTFPTLYAAVVYWYLAPGASDPYPPLPLADRVGYWRAPQRP